jgi:hypothetical protein
MYVLERVLCNEITLTFSTRKWYFRQNKCQGCHQNRHLLHKEGEESLIWWLSISGLKKYSLNFRHSYLSEIYTWNSWFKISAQWVALMTEVFVVYQVSSDKYCVNTHFMFLTTLRPLWYICMFVTSVRTAPQIIVSHCFTVPCYVTYFTSLWHTITLIQKEYTCSKLMMVYYFKNSPIFKSMYKFVRKLNTDNQPP